MSAGSWVKGVGERGDDIQEAAEDEWSDSSMEKYAQMTFKMGSMSANDSQIFASCHLCKLVQDYYKYRNSFNIIRCETNSNQRQG